jgi:hypothetical protein
MDSSEYPETHPYTAENWPIATCLLGFPAVGDPKRILFSNPVHDRLTTDELPRPRTVPKGTLRPGQFVWLGGRVAPRLRLAGSRPEVDTLSVARELVNSAQLILGERGVVERSEVFVELLHR